MKTRTCIVSESAETEDHWEPTPEDLEMLAEWEESERRGVTPPWVEAAFDGIDWNEILLQDQYLSEVRRRLKLGANDEDDDEGLMDHTDAYYARGLSEQKCAEAWLARVN